MANSLYTPFVNSYLTQGANQVDFDLPDDIRIILIDAADYTVNLTTHDFLDDIPAGARVATVALTGESVSGRTFDASDATFTAVTGDQSEALVIYKHTGTESTSRLIAYIDSATNLPVTPNGGDITVAWDNGANKIFSL
jgi:hypothetical protein